MDNAKRFLGEGIFFESRPNPPQYDRANSAFQLCVEEIGKAALLLQFHEERANGRETDFDLLLAAFRDHGKKTIKVLELLKAIFSRLRMDNPAYAKHVKVMEKLLVSSSDYERRRQRGLYVSFEKGKFLSPSEMVFKEDSAHTLLIAHNSFNFVEQWWFTVSEPGYVRNSKGFAALREKSVSTGEGGLSDIFLPMLKGRTLQ